LEEHHVRLLTFACEAWDRAAQAREQLAQDLPGGAAYDGLLEETSRSIQRIFSWVVFDCSTVLAAADRERTAIANFRARHPTGAESISDFLDLYVDNLAWLEAWSLELHGSPQPHEWRMGSPHQTYESAAKAAKRK
jgi:hypothetical protein